MKKKFLISFIVFFVFLSLFILFLQKKESVAEKETQFLPMNSEQKTYLKETQEAVKKINERNKNIPATIKEKMKQQAVKMLSTSDAMIQPVTFYGKVIDQKNNPIANVGVMFDGGRSAYSFGSGPDKTTTNEQGMFSITEAKAYTLSVDKMKKEGYDLSHAKKTFRSYNDSNFKSWKDYSSPDKPYIFNGWKIERYPKVQISAEKGYSLTPDGRTSTFDLLTKGKPFKKGLQEGDLTISFDEMGESWVARIESLAGGLIETDSVYMNLAPEAGYQIAITYQFPIGRRNIEIKNYYLKMRDGYYGRVKVEYRAYPNRKGKATVYVSSVVNLEKGRNLTIKKQ
jgi:hypothetical protein